MAPSADRSAHDRLSLWEKGGAIAVLPVRFLLRLPGLSAQLSQFFLKEVITRPAVLVAILFHGGLLVLPALELTEPVAEALNAPEEEDEPIEVQSLSDLVAAAPEPATPPPEQPATPPPAAPPVQQVITEVPPDLPEELPPIDETPPDDTFQDEPPLAPDPNEPPAPAFDRGAAQTGMLGTASGSGYVDAVPPASFVANDQPSYFSPDSRGGFSISASPLPNVISMFYFDIVTYPDGGFAEAQKLAAGNRLFLQDAGNYAGSPLYAAVNDANEPATYISLVVPRDGDSTILVLWNENPNG
ncbi:MAG: hypothetical protein AAFZ80_00385 [Cyanobacteria bacterium P01_A01_bin.105]